MEVICQASCMILAIDAVVMSDEGERVDDTKREIVQVSSNPYFHRSTKILSRPRSVWSEREWGCG